MSFVEPYSRVHAGAVLLTVSNGPTINGLFLMFVIVQAIYGVGVGGEYPVVRHMYLYIASYLHS